MPSLVELLRNCAVDVECPVATDNPLRQVVSSTYSPEIARQLSFGDIVFVERAKTGDKGPVSVFRPVAGEWRANPNLGSADDMKSHPIDRQAVVDFIGGSPVGREFKQFELEFGSAR